MSQTKLSTKDLQTLGELLNCEHLAYKKCTVYQSMTTDKALIELLQGLCMCHKTRYTNLLSRLNSAN